MGGAVARSPRTLVRMTLDIPDTGDSVWRRAELSGADPG
jgi:hypothetical protein